MNKIDYTSDVEVILSRRYANGADYWAGPVGRIYVGNPFSTISSLVMLHELGLGASHEAVKGGLNLILNASREDGRIRVAPKSPMYPCYTAEAARVLCRFGMETSEAVKRSVSYFNGSIHELGGWRCNFTKFGRGPETVHANPGATLYVLDVLRFFPEYFQHDAGVDRAVDFLLGHWDTRLPIGPCHWGIGSRFTKIEFPFLRYNLFYYVYVLSYFYRAREDTRFKSAFDALKSKLDEDGQMVVENPHRGLKGLSFCAKGLPSKLATARYFEICQNILS